jgi:hypothetical protein
MIYVDNFYLHPLAAYREMSYNEDALHEFAARLGLRRSWFHRDHYDIGYGKRDMALTFGARGITYRKMALMVTTYRKSRGAIRTIPRRGHV